MGLVAGVVRSAAIGALVLLAAGRAHAVSESYVFDDGFAVLNVFHVLPGGGLDLVGGPLTIDLDGEEVMVDEAGLTILSIDLTSAGPWVLPVDPIPTGGVTAITISEATLTAGSGPLTLLDPGPPRTYDYAASPVVVISDLLATGPGLTPMFADDFAMNSPSASGTLFISGSGLGATLTIDGITLSQFVSPFSGKDTVVKADFVFQGTNPIPEPGSALLLAGSLAALATTARLRARRAG